MHVLHGIKAAEYACDRVQMEEEGKSAEREQDAASGEYPVIQDLVNT